MSLHENQTQTANAEQSPEGRQPYFDLNQLDPLQVADLLGVFGDALNESSELSMIKGEAVPGHIERMAKLLDPLADDVADFADRNPEKAYMLAETLASSEHPWARATAVDGYCRLLRHLPVESSDHEAALNRLHGLLQDPDDAVTDSADEVLGALVETDDLDEPTLRRIDAWLPEERKRERAWLTGQ